ncbi:hypothetical protein CHL67_05245 [Prosthecochloris sp. GSB1]|nr:hypothetical protein CHL67_05245 [Prosthecochloris sp. GSB1]
MQFDNEGSAPRDWRMKGGLVATFPLFSEAEKKLIRPLTVAFIACVRQSKGELRASAKFAHFGVGKYRAYAYNHGQLISCPVVNE